MQVFEISGVRFMVILDNSSDFCQKPFRWECIAAVAKVRLFFKSINQRYWTNIYGHLGVHERDKEVDFISQDDCQVTLDQREASQGSVEGTIRVAFCQYKDRGLGNIYNPRG